MGVLALLTEDAVSILAGIFNLPWGIYLDGIPVILADNVVSFEFDQRFTISDYPVEQGGFASFNKVYQPFDIVIRFTAGGDLVNRQAFLDSISAIIGGTALYDVVTADATYLSVSLVGYRYQQTAASGIGLIQVDVAARQVKDASTIALLNALTNPANPADASQIVGGVVQTIAPTLPQLSSLSSIIGFG